MDTCPWLRSRWNSHRGRGGHFRLGGNPRLHVQRRQRIFCPPGAGRQHVARLPHWRRGHHQENALLRIWRGLRGLYQWLRRHLETGQAG